MDEYFKLLCWIFCVWDALIFFIILFAFFSVRNILKVLRTINFRHGEEIELQKDIHERLCNIWIELENLK